MKLLKINLYYGFDKVQCVNAMYNATLGKIFLVVLNKETLLVPNAAAKRLSCQFKINVEKTGKGEYKTIQKSPE